MKLSIIPKLRNIVNNKSWIKFYQSDNIIIKTFLTIIIIFKNFFKSITKINFIAKFFILFILFLYIILTIWIIILLLLFFFYMISNKAFIEVSIIIMLLIFSLFYLGLFFTIILLFTEAQNNICDELKFIILLNLFCFHHIIFFK